MGEKKKVGFTCAYAPLALIDAAGFVPYRILPLGENPDQAGSLLHDNLCPHIKRLLDRALNADLPELAGLVFMNSCDAMRRLADAWVSIRSGDNVILVDLPAGVQCEPVISHGSGESAKLVKLKLIATSGTTAANGPFRVEGTSPAGDADQRLATFPLSGWLTESGCWLTVKN